VAGKNILAGGLLPFSPGAAALLLDEFKALMKQARREFRQLTKEAQLPRAPREDGHVADLLFLTTAAPIFSSVWLDDVLASALDQSLPTILNSDGDEVEFCRVRFPLTSEGSAGELRDRLRTIPAFQEENDAFWNWIEPRERAKPARRGKPVNRSSPRKSGALEATLNDGGTILGAIELTDTALVLEVNSRERAERGRAILADLAGTLVGTHLMEIETIKQAMARRDGDPCRGKRAIFPPSCRQKSFTPR
jgi:hypothetical protein